MKRSVVLVGLLFAIGLWFVGIGPAQADDLELEVREIARSLQCPVCESVSVADSTSELAGQMRALIRKKLEEGESREQIVAYFVERYGEGVLSDPPKSGSMLWVWLVPLGGVILGATVVVGVLRSWRSGPAGSAADPVSADGAESLGRYEERVQREIEALERS